MDDIALFDLYTSVPLPYQTWAVITEMMLYLEKTLVYRKKGCVHFDVSMFTHKTMSNKRSLIKKTIPRSKWIILRGLKTNQILMSAFFFLQNFNYPKTKNILFN